MASTSPHAYIAAGHHQIAFVVNDISAAAGGGVVPPAGASQTGSEGVAGGGPAEGMMPARR